MRHWKRLMWHWKSVAGVSWMARAGMVLTCLQSQLAIGKGNSNYNYNYDRNGRWWALQVLNHHCNFSIVVILYLQQHQATPKWSSNTKEPEAHMCIFRGVCVLASLWIWNHAAMLRLPNVVNHDMRWTRYVRMSNGQVAICRTWMMRNMTKYLAIIMTQVFLDFSHARACYSTQKR